jgi:glycosyltransferase involved in cell wall biosynthesis
VVVDNRSTDDTVEIARRYADTVLECGPERSAQRNAGAAAVEAQTVGFVDADMVLDPAVAEEALAAIHAGAGAVVVPERTVGPGYWTAVRRFERSLYVGSDGVEAARFFRADLFREVGGYDEEMTGMEDRDLHLRILSRARIARSAAWIDHQEAGVSYRQLLAKKAYYAPGIQRFARKHGRGARLTLDLPYVRRPWRLLVPHPLLGAGVAALKLGEAVSILLALRRLRRASGSAGAGGG